MFCEYVCVCVYVAIASIERWKETVKRTNDCCACVYLTAKMRGEKEKRGDCDRQANHIQRERNILAINLSNLYSAPCVSKLPNEQGIKRKIVYE